MTIAEFRRPRRDRGRRRGRKGLSAAAKVGIGAAAVGAVGLGAIALRRRKPGGALVARKASRSGSGGARAVKTTVVPPGAPDPTKGAGRGYGNKRSYKFKRKSQNAEFQGDAMQSLSLAGVEQDILSGRAEFRKPRRDRGRRRGKRGGLSTAGKIGIGAAGLGVAAGGALAASKLMRGKGKSTPRTALMPGGSKGGGMVAQPGKGMSGQKGVAAGIGKRRAGLSDRLSSLGTAANRLKGKASAGAGRMRQRMKSKRY